MGDRIQIPNGCMAEIAEYKEQVVHDYKGNAYIEALPSLLTAAESIQKLSNYPEYSHDERGLESHFRVHMINRIFQVFQPLPMTMQLENKISTSIRQGYIKRSQFSWEMAQGFCKDYGKIKNIGISEDRNYNSSSSGFTLLGISGLGKTTSLNHILHLYPQVIVHKDYKGTPLSNYQVSWLKLECPYDGSLKGLMFEFFSSIDRLLGTNYFQKMVSSRATTDMMLSVMNQVVRNTSLGLLVIDEIQHLNAAKSGGDSKMLNFFVNLYNIVNLPILVVGTPLAMGVLQKNEFRQARRNIGLSGDMICDRLKNDKQFELLVRTIWHYQWTRSEITLTEEIINTLYDEVQGVPDLLIKVYSIVQSYAISTGIENITPSIIKKCAKENLKMVQPMIQALKSGNLREMAKYEDVYIPDIDYTNVLTHTKESIKANFASEAKTRQIKQKSQEDAQKISTPLKKDPVKIKTENTKVENNILDIRYIAEEGIKTNKSVYEAIKDAGYIKNYENDIFWRAE